MKPNGIRHSRIAATPDGVVSVAPGYRGCRSFLAQPPANRWHPSGMAQTTQTFRCRRSAQPPANRWHPSGTAIPEPGGFKAISRGLRRTAPTPPDRTPHGSRIPEGCQPARLLTERHRLPRDAATPDGVVSLPSGYRGCRSAQPPANRWHPSGIAGAIASVLTEMDVELAVLEQRQEKTRALKQAMMQELLTGRTRLV